MKTLAFDPHSGSRSTKSVGSQCVVLACFAPEEVDRFWEDRAILSEVLSGFNAQIHWVDHKQSPESWKECLLDIRPSVILGAWSLPQITDEILEALPEFKYLCYFCGAIRSKVSRLFIERGGIVTNWGGLAATAVAECAVALVMACARRMSRYTLEMHVDRSFNWLGDPYPLSLSGRSVGIHGIGAVSRTCIRILSAFNMNIECWSQGAPVRLFEQAGVRQAKSLEALYTQNDIVIEAEALNEHTEGCVTTELLCRMKANAIFVNVGRGAVLEAGAVEALAERGDVALGLDVYSEEPLPADNSLRGRRNVMLLPHTAGPTVDQYLQIRDQSLRFLKDYLHGKPLAASIDSDAYDRMT